MPKLNPYLPASLQVRRNSPPPGRPGTPPSPTLKQRGPLGTTLATVAGFVAAAGFTAALVVLLNMMLEVTAQGGFCAKGGPYVIQNECSDQVALLTPLSIFAMVIFVGIGIAARGVGYLVAVLAWPALFCTLGGGFIYSAQYPSFGPTGYFLGGLFLLMGGVPLLLGIRGLIRSMIQSRSHPEPAPGGVIETTDTTRDVILPLLGVVLFLAAIAIGWYAAQWLLAVV